MTLLTSRSASDLPDPSCLLSRLPASSRSAPWLFLPCFFRPPPVRFPDIFGGRFWSRQTQNNLLFDCYFSYTCTHSLAGSNAPDLPGISILVFSVSVTGISLFRMLSPLIESHLIPPGASDASSLTYLLCLSLILPASILYYFFVSTTSFPAEVLINVYFFRSRDVLLLSPQEMRIIWYKRCAAGHRQFNIDSVYTSTRGPFCACVWLRIVLECKTWNRTVGRKTFCREWSVPQYVWVK